MLAFARCVRAQAAIAPDVENDLPLLRIAPPKKASGARVSHNRAAPAASKRTRGVAAEPAGARVGRARIAGVR